MDKLNSDMIRVAVTSLFVFGSMLHNAPKPKLARAGLPFMLAAIVILLYIVADKNLAH